MPAVVCDFMDVLNGLMFEDMGLFLPGPQWRWAIWLRMRRRSWSRRAVQCGVIVQGRVPAMRVAGYAIGGQADCW